MFPMGPPFSKISRSFRSMLSCSREGSPAFFFSHLIGQGHFLTTLKRNGLPQIGALDLHSQKVYPVSLPFSLGKFRSCANADHKAPYFHFSASSPLLPTRYFRYNFYSKYPEFHFFTSSSAFHHHSLVCRETEDLGKSIKDSMVNDFNPSQYVLNQETVPGDKVKLAVTLAHHQDLSFTQDHPTLLFGYGAYGETLEPQFHSSALSLLNRGWVLAFCHVR